MPNDVLKQRKVTIYDVVFRDDGIVYIFVSGKRPTTIEDQVLVVKTLGEMGGEKKMPLLIKHETSSLPDSSARNNWAKKNTNPYSLAEAFVVNNLAHKVIANFYLKTNKPGRPTKIFTNEEDAVIWLKTFL